MDLVEKIRVLNNHLKAKNFKRVIEGSSKILKQIPRNDYLLNLTGMAYQGLSQHKNSIKYFKEALKYAPNNIAAMNNYANSLKAVGNLEASEELYKNILKINPGYINAYNNYANLKTLINDYDGAIDLYKKALEILKENTNVPKASSLGILFSLAVAYQSNNNIEDTRQTIKQIFLIEASHVGAHKLISSITKYSIEDKNSLNHLKTMEQLDSQINDNNYERKLDISYALGKSYEDLRDYKKSFYYLNIANELKLKEKGSNIDAEKKAIQNIIKTFDGIDLDKTNQDINQKKIIFICGMPRSGTALAEQIISSHSEVYGAGELIYLQQVLKKNFVENFKYNKQHIIENQSLPKNVISSEYHEYFKLYNIKENIITDKAPQNFRLIGFIKLFFPNCKIIHCHRNPKDNCLSLFKNSFASQTMNWTNKAEDIAEYYNLYSEIMKFWKVKIPNFIYDLDYDKLVQDKESEIRKILNFCELEWDEKCLNPSKNSKTPIKTVSIAQARQPIYKSSLNSSDNYEKYLSKMFGILK